MQWKKLFSVLFIVNFSQKLAENLTNVSKYGLTPSTFETYIFSHFYLYLHKLFLENIPSTDNSIDAYVQLRDIHNFNSTDLGIWYTVYLKFLELHNFIYFVISEFTCGRLKSDFILCLLLAIPLDWGIKIKNKNSHIHVYRSDFDCTHES